MTKTPKCFSRRDFLKSAGIGSMLAAAGTIAGGVEKSQAAPSPPAKVPLRPFGKTGINVPILSLGGIINFKQNQILLRQAVKMGVTYWDTAESYVSGRSEEGMGQYFTRYPKDRKKIFLVTKAQSRNTDYLTDALDASLARLKTDYVDLFFIHGVSDVEYEIDDNILQWGQKAKAQKKIRLFGFSTHANMAECLLAAAKLDGIDGIMMTYNYRMMGTDDMQAAVAACHRAGIGLTAMKTQANSVWADMGQKTESAIKLTDRFLQEGYTPEQAKLKAVWQDPRIASICSQMSSMTLMMANAAAAMGQTTISRQAGDLLEEYARETDHCYCAGCTHVCENAVGGNVAIGVVMRCLMYARSYNDLQRAKTAFQRLPEAMRADLNRLDYTLAEKRCPNRMPIARLMQEAVEELV